MNWILCITFIWYHVILQQAHIVVSDQMPIPQPSVPRQANKPFPHKMWVLSFLPTLGHSTRGGDYGEIVSTCLSLLPNVKSFSQFLCFFFFFFLPREPCFIYSREFGMFLGGQHPVASPPATRTCLYFYAYFNAEFSMCVFIWFFYVLNSTVHKGIICCVKNN